MKLISLKIKGFKNLDFWDNPIDFTKSEGISIFVGNNGSGKSNVLEAISAIFYGLYDETNERRCAFSYELKYNIEGQEIFIKQDYKKSGNSLGTLSKEEVELFGILNEVRVVGYYINSVQVYNLDKKLLPSKIIALYSGEEIRLYQLYYKYIFQNYINGVLRTNKILEYPKMTFLDKDYWNIVLLTMFMSVYSFNSTDSDPIYIGLEKILGKGISLEEIYFDIDEDKLKSFKDNEITNFVRILSGINNISIENLIEFNNKTGTLGGRDDFFNNLTIACNQKDLKNSLILNIHIELNNGINTIDLSEGQKKQILLFFATNFLADKDSLVLLDEPDSYIHVGNKQRLKEFFSDFLNITKEGEFIMTTHSPTLMNKFDNKHLYYLENGKLDLMEKREILDKITDGQMSLNEMEVFLNSGNKYLLVTEGITDKKHLEIAIEKLGLENNYDIYSADSCEKLTNFLVTLPNDIFANKIIIGIYDYDQAGLTALKRLGEKIEENKKYKVSGKNNRFGISLPYTNKNFENNPVFTIEFMYSKEILKTNKMIEYRTVDDINRCIKNQDDKLNLFEIKSKDELCFYKVTESENSKNNFTEIVRKLESREFENFRTLLNMIDSII